MTPEVWAEIRKLLEQVMDLPASERPAFLATCGSSVEVIAQVERLLSFEQQASSVFSIESWHGRAARSAAEADLSGMLVGSYKLLRELGRGGMGAVYLAERADGTYQQQVAVKILQENIFTEALANRFRQERQILARLTHPGVARLLDGGVLPDGRPYLVLEYVDGVSIDRYASEHALSLEQRLRLFLRVAEVVQSAHQQLILHLDLKPANILVTPEGEPRLLDFGLARLVSDSDMRAEATLRMLTPRYASPEQASGAPLGVASDVFSLATLLYRLLTGVLPYPLEDATPLAAIRILNETAPTVPSQITPALKGDLDTILLQALRKEPERRYPTVEAFSEDLQRYLDWRPVLAHKDSVRYRVGKFLRRNRLSVVAAALAFCVVVASAVAVVHSATVARRDRASAERRLHDIEDLARFYVVDLFAAMNDIPGTLPVRKVMTENAVKYLQSMTNERNGDPNFSLELANGLFE
ncbi:MAG: serine/threonine-protein kinase, partial [Bryocella sp.]